MTNATYMRWKRGASRRGRVFMPLTAGHPSVSAPCVLCPEVIGTERAVQLVVIGPEPGDGEAAARHHADRWYSALALIVHETCMDNTSDAELDVLAGEIKERSSSREETV